jgi:hypothetical protein
MLGAQPSGDLFFALPGEASVGAAAGPPVRRDFVLGNIPPPLGDLRVELGEARRINQDAIGPAGYQLVRIPEPVLIDKYFEAGTHSAVYFDGLRL